MKTEVYCPSCGRYVGPVEKCPYCLGTIPKSRIYLVVKYCSLAFALFGILVLHQLAVYTNNELRLSAISMRNNYASVFIEGHVISIPMFFRTENLGSLYFDVDDGTGTGTVRTYDTGTRSLVDADKIPAFGDRIRARVQIQYRGNDFNLVLNDANHITIFPRKFTPITIRELNELSYEPVREGKWYVINGTFESHRSYSFADVLVLKEGDAKIDIFVPRSVLELTKGSAPLPWNIMSPGDRVRVEGALKYYSKAQKWELIPASIKAIKKL